MGEGKKKHTVAVNLDCGVDNERGLVLSQSRVQMCIVCKPVLELCSQNIQSSDFLSFRRNQERIKKLEHDAMRYIPSLGTPVWKILCQGTLGPR